jgi:chromosome segregation ATPase
LPIQQPHIQEPSLQAQSVVLHDADKVALQREIANLREEKRILEQRSTQAQTRNDELHEQLVGLNNDHDRVESELAATRRGMEHLKQILVQRRYNKGHEQSQGDTMVEHVQFTVSIQDASRVKELYDDLLSYMVFSETEAGF